MRELLARIRPHLPRWIALTVCVGGALFLSVEVWMQAVRHTSLCSTTSCAVVGEYIRFGEGNLIKLGAVFFWCLWGVVFFAGRYPKPWFWGLAWLLVAGALAFDGVLLGFQFVALREFCLLCAITGSILLAALLSLAWTRRAVAPIVLGLAVWSGGFVGASVIDFQVQPPALSETVALSWGQTANATARRHVLFFSLHCSHCSKVLANLAINVEHLGDAAWYFAPLDSREDDLHRLVAVQESPATQDNPFMEVLRVESLEQVPAVPVPEKLRQTVRTARSYFKTKGYDGVPVLVVWEAPGRELVLRGETPIFRYLQERGYLQRSVLVNLPPSS